MFFTTALAVSLSIFVIGLLYRIWTWFNISIGPEARHYSLGQRIAGTAAGIAGILFSSKLIVFTKVLISDVILQLHILKQDKQRWIMHMCIYGGFTLLLLMHALQSVVSSVIFPDYESTLNPFLFLRNIFGVMVMVGIGIAIYRRVNIKPLKKLTRPVDRYAIILLAVIMGSGFLLEALKIVSYPVFFEMVDDYAGIDDPEEMTPLKAYWEKHYDVVFPGKLAPPASADLELGREIHEDNCAACHSAPASAFISYTAASFIKPVALKLYEFRVNIWEMRLDRWMYWIHILACFIGLAYLPFSKMFHIITSPLSLIIFGTSNKKEETLHPVLSELTWRTAASNGNGNGNGNGKGKGILAARMATRRVMALDACTHCGTCTLHCSVAPIFKKISNAAILPSEKIFTARNIISENAGVEELMTLQEGNYICTNCYRCTTMCPSGINLQDLWSALRVELVNRGVPAPENWAKESGAAIVARIKSNGVKPLVPSTVSLKKELNMSDRVDTFSSCFKCRTCSNVCPVVKNCDNPSEELDMLPHQIMHSLGLGLKDLALGSRMIWDCLTCYECQENCPQNVRITDIFYELKNIAYASYKSEAQPHADGKEAQ